MSKLTTNEIILGAIVLAALKKEAEEKAEERRITSEIERIRREVKEGIRRFDSQKN